MTAHIVTRPLVGVVSFRAGDNWLAAAQSKDERGTTTLVCETDNGTRQSTYC